MNKKLLITTATLATSFSLAVQAQSYDYNYPAYGGQHNYDTYKTYQQYAYPEKAQNNYKFSIGLDYVLGDVSSTDQTFDILSPLVADGLPEEYYTAESEKFDNSPDLLNINFGFKPFKYLGFELFYQQSLPNQEVKYQEHYSADYRYAEAKYDIDYKAYGLDAIGYLPVLSGMDLLATIGIAQYDIDGTVDLTAYRNDSSQKWKSNSHSISDSKFALRYGAGLQFWLDRNKRTALRAMYRFTEIGGDYIDDIKEIAIGVRRYF